jgi:hypothetical protein
VPFIFKGLKMHQFRPCLMGTEAALATMLMENGSPASFSESDPLSGGEANVPEAVMVTFGAVSGSVAPLNPETVNQDTATNVARKEALFRTLFKAI